MTVRIESEIELETFLVLRGHLNIAHHVPGRIRLRVGSSIFKELKGVDAKTFDKVLNAIPGIKDVRVNVMAGSVVIQYASKQIKPAWWEVLVNGEEGRASSLLLKLLEGELAPAVEAARGA